MAIGKQFSQKIEWPDKARIAVVLQVPFEQFDMTRRDTLGMLKKWLTSHFFQVSWQIKANQTYC